ncbi:MAG: flippase activity-associated protein Agl23, partial [Anaerolineales bacterium]
MATTTLDQRPSVFDRPLASALALNWEKVLYIALIAAAFVTRFYDLGARVMSHDESLHTQYSWYLYQGRGFQHSPLMHGPLKFEVTAFFYWLFGDNDFTSRIPGALMGVAAVGLMWYFRKWLGRAGALVAALLMLISPYMLYYSRYIRDEPYVMVWGLLVALCVLNYMETRAARYLYWLSAVSALFYATMEASFIYIAITMLFLGLHVVRELFAVNWPKPEFRRPFNIAFAVTLIALLAMVGFLFL